MAFAAALGANADTVDIVFSELGYANAEDVTTVDTKGSPISVVCDKNTSSNPPKYYNTGTGLRLYSGNTMTISVVEGYEISNIEFTAAGNNYAVKGNTKDADNNDNGSFSVSGANSTWTGQSSKIILNSTATCRLQKYNPQNEAYKN